MGNLGEELKIRLNYVECNNPLGVIEEPDILQIITDIQEFQSPMSEDWASNELFKILKYWSMGSARFPVAPQIIGDEMPEISLNLIKSAFESWNLGSWEDVPKRNEEYIPQYSDISILEVGCFMGEYSMNLIRTDNKIVGLDIQPWLIEVADFRKKHFLDDELKQNIEFVEGNFLNSVNDPIGQFDLIFMNFPYPYQDSVLAYEPVKFLYACLENLKPGGEATLITEVDDIFFRYDAILLDGLRKKRAYELYDCPVDTSTSRALLKENPGRPFYEIVWGKSG